MIKIKHKIKFEVSNNESNLLIEINIYYYLKDETEMSIIEENELEYKIESLTKTY